ncbi:flagellin N-terminal helical domain-containing protein [Anaerobiospirillum thomasii]|uniref:Flagellin n=1 Tax=Anaerobiospirillum thomasii TaxID=179995 RepID=A0A2X0VJ36_9GAMM|nr:flagellin [Anaerobiospirillum thomasii]SPT69498.1 A-type flagellin [Anaerobiospirillum thomasii]
MALFVNTNVSSINGQRNLTNATNNLNTTYQRLSSGMRINSAKDDAAGLQISDRLTSQINGLNQGNRNTNDGIALAQTAEGAMDEMTNMLQRIRTLAVQSSNGTNNAKDREAIQQEVTQLSNEITRIAEQTKFGGQSFLFGGKADGSTIANDKGIITIQVGAYNGDTLQMTGFSTGFALSMISERLGGHTADDNGFEDNLFMVAKQSHATAAITTVDAFIADIDKQRAHLGAMQNRMESSIRNQSNVSMNVSDARARIRDTDFAEESAKLSQQTIIQQAASSMLTQANSRPQLALSLLG